MIGRNKSGCLWKKGTSVRAGANNVSLVRSSWNKRLEERKKDASLKARLTELTNARIAVKREERARKMAK